MPAPVRVLYVDDEPDLLDLAKIYLEDQGGFTIDTLTSAETALEQQKNVRYDAILSDYQMPGMDGIAFLKQVRAVDKNIPFIIFTGKGREEIAIEAFENGADFYLQKGGEPKSQFAELSKKIKKAVDHRQANIEVAVLSRLYNVLSATNKAIVRIHDKLELLEEICRIVVDIGGFRMAWGGLVNREQQVIKPVAVYGDSDGYIDTIIISTDDILQGRGPAGTTYRERTFTVCNDILSDPTMAPWRDEAEKRGYRSVASFPFALNTGNPGVISFYASETGFFTDQIIRLLDEQSTDITYAFVTMDHEEERASAENNLKMSELQYRRLFETAQDAILILEGNTGEVIDANKFILDMLGYPLEYFIGKHLWELGFIKDKSIAQDAFTELKTNDYIRYEDLPLETIDGRSIDVEFISNVYLVGDKKIIQCNIRNITDRKQTEEEINRQYSFMKGILESTGSAVFSLDRNYCYTSFNSHHAEIMKQLYGADIQPGGNIFEYQSVTSDQSIAKSNINRALAGEQFTDEAYSGEEGRSRRYFEVTHNPVRDSEQQVIGVAIFARDITERRQTEEALRETNEYLNNLIDYANTPIIVWDPEFRITRFNHAFEDLTLISEQEVLGQQIDVLFPPESRDSSLLKIKKTVAGERWETVDIPILVKDGSVRTVLWNSANILDTKGMIISTIAQGVDITARKRVEEGLRASELRYRSLFENMLEGFAYCRMLYDNNGDPSDFIYLNVNPSFDRIIGTNTVTGKPVTEVFPGIRDAFPELFEIYGRVAMTGEPESFDLNFTPAQKWLHISVYSPAKEYFVAVFDDITEHKLLEYETKYHEEELRQLSSALGVANKKLTLLSGITRHDINNQLTVLMGYLVILEMEQTDPSFNGYFNKITNAAERIQAMIQFTKTYEGIGVNAPIWQNIHELVYIAVNGVVLGEIRFVNDIPDDLIVFADQLIVKVFFNLMDNAVRYGGKITTIRFYTETQDEGVCIVCEDDGNGIAVLEKEKIFDRGFGKNTGLGLFLSREILAITGITIAETGVPGKGGRFEITVPKGMFRYS